MTNQRSRPGKPARASVRRKKAKSQIMGPLLPSLMTALVQPLAGTNLTTSSTLTGLSAASRNRQRVGRRPRPDQGGITSWGRLSQTNDVQRISVKYHLPRAATPSRKAGESPYKASAATHRQGK